MEDDKQTTRTQSPPVIVAAARWSGTVALAVLLFSLFLFVWMWARAYQTGAMPDADWGTYGGNHGPWRHRYDLRGAFWQVLQVQFQAFAIGTVSFCIRPNRKAAVVVSAAFLAGVSFLFSHYWLVD